jgi:hypothetical protein
MIKRLPEVFPDRHILASSRPFDAFQKMLFPDLAGRSPPLLLSRANGLLKLMLIDARFERGVMNEFRFWIISSLT